MENKDDTKYRMSALSFFAAKKSFEKQKQEFEVLKKSFYSDFGRYFASRGFDKSVTYSFGDSDVTVSKVQRVAIVFDAEKLSRRLQKKIASKVIKKKYEIADYEGFVEYMKKVGAKPCDVKKFLNVTKEVDKEALDQLEAIGEIDEDMIDGCYEAKVSEPTFQFREKKRKEHED